MSLAFLMYHNENPREGKHELLLSLLNTVASVLLLQRILIRCIHSQSILET